MSVPVRDSRTMHGARLEATPEEIRARWQEHARAMEARGGFENRKGSLELELRSDSIRAYVSDNRWVADCPECAGGMACWVAMPDACCYDCGRVWLVEFPPPAVLSEGLEALEARPVQNRHWRPWGETPADLKVENVLRGYRPS